MSDNTKKYEKYWDNFNKEVYKNYIKRKKDWKSKMN